MSHIFSRCPHFVVVQPIFAGNMWDPGTAFKKPPGVSGGSDPSMVWCRALRKLGLTS